MISAFCDGTFSLPVTIRVMEFIDTHCHIHDREFYADTREEVFDRARAANVSMLCVGTSQADSRSAVEFTANHADSWAVVGVHPHESKDGVGEIEQILATKGTKSSKIVGIGEIGLDYFYNNSPREVQIQALEQQLQWAKDYNLPVSFHVREAYDDFWPIVANYSGICGVLHSFTDSRQNLEIALQNGLFIGVNGISTFAKDKGEMFDAVPLEKMLLETDAPFLTPVPFRGTMNEPAFVRNVAEFHAERRHVELEHLARVTSANARELFSI